MNYAGEYPQPLARNQILHTVVVPGSLTARLEAQALPKNADDRLTIAIVENDGLTQLDVQFVECSSYTSGPRTNVGSAISVVPQGRESVTMNPTSRYLEVWGVLGRGTVNSRMRLQLQSKMRWNELGFNKDDANYAKILWQPQGL